MLADTGCLVRLWIGAAWKTEPIARLAQSGARRKLPAGPESGFRSAGFPKIPGEYHTIREMLSRLMIPWQVIIQPQHLIFRKPDLFKIHFNQKIGECHEK